MLMLSMETKRQRRPNVRLGEIGDVAAAFSCGVSHKLKKDLQWENRLDYSFLNPDESEFNYFSGFCQDRSSDFDFSDSAVIPWLMDTEQNRENENPNSMNFVSEFERLDEFEMIKSDELDYGTVARSCMLVNKGRRSKRCRRTVFGDYWSSEIISITNTENGNEYKGKEVIDFASNPHLNGSGAYGFNATLNPDYGASAMSKEVCEDDRDEPTFKSLSSESFDRDDMLEVCHNVVDKVGRWLEELGFGNYAGLFERHEVDEETLPLLTLEDLKEMGVVAVGPRRKLYTAIRQLRDCSGQ